MPSERPLISCITTTYNEGAPGLTGLRSLLAQGFGDFEVIVVDDGSTDDTPALVEGLGDPRLRLIRQANDGVSAARNKALEQVRGEYVCFLDADDSRPGWALGAIAEVIGREAPDLILCRGMLQGVRGAPEPFFDADRFDAVAALLPGAGPVTRAHPLAAALRALAQLMEQQPANKVLRAGLIREAGLRFPDTHFFEDIFFHSTAVAAAERLSFVQTPGFVYRRHYLRAQTTGGTGELRLDIIPVVRMTLEALALRPEFHEPLHRRAVMASCVRLLGWCGRELAYQHRPAYRLMVAAMLRLVDPLWLHLPDLPDGAVPEPLRRALGDPAALRAELEGLRDAG